MRISDWSSDVCSSDLRTSQYRSAEPAVYSQTRSLIPPLKGWLAWTDSLVARLGSAGRLQCVDVDADGDRADHLTGRRVDDRHGYLRLEGLRGLIHLRSEEHTSELQSLMRISYAVFFLKTKHILYKN